MILFTTLAITTVAVVWTWFLWQEERRQTGGFVITPLVGWVFLYLLVVVYSALVRETWDVLFIDPWALGLATTAYLMFLAGFTWFRRPHVLGRYFDKPLSLPVGETQRSHYRAANFFVLFLLLVAFLTYWGLPPIIESWRSILRGEFSEAAVLSSVERFRLTKSPWFGGADRGTMIFRSISHVGWPFLVVLSLVWMRVNPPGSLWRRRWLRLMVACSIVGLVVIGGDFTRLPVLAAIAMVTIGFTMYRPARLRSLAGVFVVALTVMLVLTASSSKGAGSDFPELVARIQNRLSLNGALDFEAIDLIREGVLEHRDGREHFNRLVSALPGVRVGVPFDYELAQIRRNNPQNTTYSSTTYLSIAFLDFGVAGVVVLYFAMGVLLALSYRWLYGQPRAPGHIAAGAVAAWILTNWSQGGALFSLNDFVVLAFIWLVFRAAMRIAPVGPSPPSAAAAGGGHHPGGPARRQLKGS